MLSSGIWLTLALLTFLATTIPYGKSKAIYYLERKIYKVKQRVEEARSLLQKSRNVLKSQKKKNKQIDEEKDKITHEARKTSEEIREVETKNIENECAREYQNALRGIEQYKDAKITEMHYEFARRSFEIAREYLKKNPPKDLDLGLIKQELRNGLKNKA